ncbi:MAG: Gfo/Idh/MocA family oxidoreductase [Thermomicrobiales bacterium]
MAQITADSAQPPKRPVIAHVGAGMMGQLAHIANYARLRDAGVCTIAGVTDLQTNLAEAVAARYAIPQVYASLDDLLADDAIDAVTCIQQWPNNYPLVKQILSAGKSAITEKPMVGRLDEAQELAALAEANGVLYAVGFMKRYDRGVERAKELIADVAASGDLGSLVMVDAICNGGDWTFGIEDPIRVPPPGPGVLPPPTPTYPDAVTTDLQRRQYDWLVNIFSHTVNLCHHLLDREMAVRTATFIETRAMAATLTAGETLVTIRGGQTTSHEWRESTTLTFEHGEIAIRTPIPMRKQSSAEVSILRPGRGRFITEQHHVAPGWAFYRQAEGFVAALGGEAPLRTPASAAVADVRVMQEIVESAIG